MMHDSSTPSDGSPQIKQGVKGDGNQMIGQVLGGMVVYGTVIYNNSPGSEDPSTPPDLRIGANPYQGLLAFQQTDGHRFFGRDLQIKELWEKLRRVHEDRAATQLLTIYGPSGSGKSSLARAGLIPALAQQPLPGCDLARVAVLVPSTHPLKSLAAVLAQIATNDLTPVAKTRVFTEELALVNTKGVYDGLQRIADLLPEIEIKPLIVLVDQLEEIFTLCEEPAERNAFIGNLLDAAADRSKRVSVIFTLSSDFLGATQQYPRLNELIASQAQSYLLVAMSKEGLREAISKPAELAKRPLDLSTIDLLIEQTDGHEGALPLLQFALTQIWAGLTEGQEPGKTLNDIGGVGGALAGEAQRIYESLNDTDQKIARWIFLGLVQLGEGVKDTRRRTDLNRLVPHKNNLEEVQKVIAKFASPAVRLITLADDQGLKTAEVTHEALFERWQMLRDWLEKSRNDLPFQRRLDEAANRWQNSGKPEGMLWRSPDLDLLKKHFNQAGDYMTTLQMNFFKAAIETEKNLLMANTEAAKRQKQLNAGLFLGLLLTLGIAFFAWQKKQEADLQVHRANIERNSSSALRQLPISPIGALISAMESGQELEPLVDSNSLKDEDGINHPVLALQTILDKIQLQNQIDTSQKQVNSFAFSANLDFIATAGESGTIKLWKHDGTEKSEIPVHPESIKINSVRFSLDEKLMATAGGDGMAKIINIEEKRILREIPAHSSNGVRNIRFGNQNKDLLITSGYDGKVKLWNTKGELQRELIDKESGLLAHQNGVETISLSESDDFIVTGGQDKMAKLWRQNGTLIARFNHEKTVKSAKFSPDKERIITAGEDDVVRIWDLKGNLKQTVPAQKTAGQGGINSVEYHDDQLITAGNNGTIKIWDSKGNLLGDFKAHENIIETIRVDRRTNTLISAGQDGIVKFWKLPNSKNSPIKPLIGHKDSVNSIRFSKDGKQVVTASSDGTVRFWNLDGTLLKTVEQNAAIESIRFMETENKTVIVTGGEHDSMVRILDLDGKILKLFSTGQGGIHSVNISANYLSTAGYDRSIKLWKKDVLLSDLNQSVQSILQHPQNLQTNRFSPDGRFIAAAGKNGMVRVWDIDKKTSWDLPGHRGTVNSLGFSQNGEKLATVGDDGTIRIWSFTPSNNFQNRIPLVQIKTSLGQIQSINFHPKGKFIATATKSGGVQFWTLSGQQLADLKVHSNRVRSADFSHDGLLFATASEDGTGTISKVRSLKDLLDQGCEWLKPHLETNPDARKKLPRCRVSPK